MALLPIISSIGQYAMHWGGAGATGTWPSANLIIYVPVRIPEAGTVLRVYWSNGSAVSGNVNLGLYDASGSRLWSTGSTAQSGTNQKQFVDIADQSLSDGLHYLALQCDNTTAAFDRCQGIAQAVTWLQMSGVMQEQAGSFALPATATFTKATNNYLPVFGLDLRGAV